MFWDDIGKKVFDIAWEKIKEKRAPRRRLAQALLRIQESLVRCQEAYLRLNESAANYDEYLDAIGQLIRTMYLVKDVLPVLDSELTQSLVDYTGDEVDTYMYPLEKSRTKYRRFQELAEEDKRAFKTLVLSWGGTEKTPDFKVLLTDIRRLLKENFTVDDMF